MALVFRLPLLETLFAIMLTFCINNIEGFHITHIEAQESIVSITFLTFSTLAFLIFYTLTEVKKAQIIHIEAWLPWRGNRLFLYYIILILASITVIIGVIDLFTSSSLLINTIKDLTN